MTSEQERTHDKVLNLTIYFDPERKYATTERADLVFSRKGCGVDCLNALCTVAVHKLNKRSRSDRGRPCILHRVENPQVQFPIPRPGSCWNDGISALNDVCCITINSAVQCALSFLVILMGACYPISPANLVDLA